MPGLAGLEPVIAPPQPPRETVQVKAVRPERDALEIRFPRVEGYRVELPEERLTADFNDDAKLVLSPDMFRGEIITTSASRELARLIMLDSAHQQEEDVRLRARRVGHDSASNDNNQPLYSTLDAQNCLNYFGRTATYTQVIEVAAGVHATFIDAGHVLGSASIFLELEEPSHSTSVLFSGDLGSNTRVLLRSPTKPPHAENVVMETTYGDRLHKQLGPSIEEFYEAITETFKRGGNVIIPTFALERAQELLYYLSEGVAQGRLTKSTQVYLDSPMAISATEIFRRHPECFERATAKLFSCLSGLHTHPPVLVFFYEQGINPLAIGADVLDAIV